MGWKLIWTAVVVLPLWTADQLDPATVSVFYACLVVLIVVAVIPVALRRRAVRDEAGGAVAPDCGPAGQ